MLDSFFAQALSLGSHWQADNWQPGGWPWSEEPTIFSRKLRIHLRADEV